MSILKHFGNDPVLSRLASVGAGLTLLVRTPSLYLR